MNLINVLATKSGVNEYTTDYYVNSKDYRGSNLIFSSTAASKYNYCILKFNLSDSKWYAITQGELKGYLDSSLGSYLYKFDFDKYISFDSNKIMSDADVLSLNFKFTGMCSSKMRFLLSTSATFVTANINAGHFTLLNDGRILVNDISQFSNFICTDKFTVNFWNREDNTTINYPIQEKVEKSSYFPITTYSNHNVYVALKDANGNKINTLEVSNGDQDFTTEFIWIPENCESIDIYEYNSNGYNEILNGVQPNLVNDSRAPLFGENAATGTMVATLKDDESSNEPYYRYQPSSSYAASVYGCITTYDDPKALYVASADVRVQSDEASAIINTYMHNDLWDSVSTTSNIEPFVWTRVFTKPFSIPLGTYPSDSSGYFIISNGSNDALGKWMDIKNVKIEKVKFNKYVNLIPKMQTSNLYGFASDQFYLQAGKTYTLRVDGNNSNATLNRHLFVEINKSGAYYSVPSTEFPGSYQKSISFTVSSSGIHYINSYYHPQIADTTGSVDLGSYYLYEGTVDPGQDITPTDWIPSSFDMKAQTNQKSFTKTVGCSGVVSNDYFYLDNNSVMDKLSCKANAFEIESIEKEYVKLGNKDFNHKTTIKKQVKQNTGYSLDEKQLYSLNKSPLVYKIHPKDYMINQNYVLNTSSEYTINNAGWIHLNLKYTLKPNTKYFFQVDVVSGFDDVNASRFLYATASNYSGDEIELTPNTYFITPADSSKFIYLNVVNNYGYSPFVFRNIMITEGDQARTFEPEVYPHFEIANYNIDNNTFDGYKHKLLNEKNFELTLTDIETTTKRNNVKTTFLD